MKVQHYAAVMVGLFVLLKNPQSRNERGLSQSAENAISARRCRHSGRDRDHVDHGLRPRQAPQDLTRARRGPR